MNIGDFPTLLPESGLVSFGMPELPEVEVLVRHLRPLLRGKTIRRVYGNTTIEKELRSQYLIAYQSTNTTGSTDFRTVELKMVNKPGMEAKTMRGYYP